MIGKLTPTIANERLADRHIICVGEIINTYTNTIWKCKDCDGVWETSPSRVLYRNTGCPTCNGNVKLTNSIVDSRLVGRNIKRLGDYVNSYAPIPWQCLLCGYVWSAIPGSVVMSQQSGCRCCSKKMPLTNTTVDDILNAKQRNITRVGDVHGNTTPIKWKCMKCTTVWETAPANILNKHSGCPSCAKQTFSQLCIDWLERVSTINNVDIQHAKRGGEYIIPGTRYKADGYCRETNTIYEFYGDKWHGNPVLFGSEMCCHPFDPTVTAGELFGRTIDREEKIKSLGFSLVTIWENDYVRNEVNDANV